MTLIIENVKDEFVPAFREFAKKMDANINTKCAESSFKPNAESSQICDYGYSHIPNDETIRALEECESGDGGTIYESYADFMKEIECELANEAKS